MPKTDKVDRVAVGGRLRDIRRSMRKTQVQMATQLGISVSHYSKMEIGASGIGPSLTKVICHTCGIHEDWLLTGSGQRTDYSAQDDTIGAVGVAEHGTEPLSDATLDQIISILLDSGKAELVERLSAELKIDDIRAWRVVIREALRDRPNTAY